MTTNDKIESIDILVKLDNTIDNKELSNNKNENLKNNENNEKNEKLEENINIDKKDEKTDEKKDDDDDWVTPLFGTILSSMKYNALFGSIAILIGTIFQAILLYNTRHNYGLICYWIDILLNIFIIIDLIFTVYAASDKIQNKNILLKTKKYLNYIIIIKLIVYIIVVFYLNLGRLLFILFMLIKEREFSFIKEIINKFDFRLLIVVGVYLVYNLFYESQKSLYKQYIKEEEEKEKLRKKNERIEVESEVEVEEKDKEKKDKEDEIEEELLKIPSLIHLSLEKFIGIVSLIGTVIYFILSYFILFYFLYSIIYINFLLLLLLDLFINNYLLQNFHPFK